MYAKIYLGLIIVFYVFCKVVWRLYQPGTSKKVRNIVIKRYIFYMIFFIMRFSPWLILIKLPASRKNPKERSVIDKIFNLQASDLAM